MGAGTETGEVIPRIVGQGPLPEMSLFSFDKNDTIEINEDVSNHSRFEMNGPNFYHLNIEGKPKVIISSVCMFLQKQNFQE